MRSRKDIEREIEPLANTIDRIILKVIAGILLDMRDLLTPPKE